MFDIEIILIIRAEEPKLNLENNPLVHVEVTGILLS